MPVKYQYTFPGPALFSQLEDFLKDIKPTDREDPMHLPLARKREVFYITPNAYANEANSRYIDNPKDRYYLFYDFSIVTPTVAIWRLTRNGKWRFYCKVPANEKFLSFWATLEALDGAYFIRPLQDARARLFVAEDKTLYDEMKAFLPRLKAGSGTYGCQRRCLKYLREYIEFLNKLAINTKSNVLMLGDVCKASPDRDVEVPLTEVAVPTVKTTIKQQARELLIKHKDRDNFKDGADRDMSKLGGLLRQIRASEQLGVPNLSSVINNISYCRMMPNEAYQLFAPVLGIVDDFKL